MEMPVLDSVELKKQLESSFRSANDLLIVSAYLTLPAVSWLYKTIPESIRQVRVVMRGRPSDFSSGASDFNACSLVLEKGGQLSMMENLHAKVYSIDSEKVFIGSANFTANGLKLFSRGNLELMARIDNPSQEVVSILECLCGEADSVSLSKLEMMKKFVGSPASQSTVDKAWWDSSIFPDEIERLLVADFPIYSEEKIESSDFLSMRSYRWLLSKLRKVDGGELYFGTITKLLHDALIDDPKPYRSDVKELVKCLLTLTQKFASSAVRIDRPRHSQRVKLI